MKKLTTQQFIEKAILLHNNKYSYCNSIYVNNRTHIAITCPIHGDFTQKAGSHLNGNGCSKCGDKQVSDKTRYSLEVFKIKANNVHNFKYTYIEYITNGVKIPIICPTHGEFLQTPNKHLNGSGCPLCFNDKRPTIRAKTTEDFITKAKKVHNNKYDYKKSVYTKSTDSIIITCPIHGDFKQEANTHLQGRGCGKCGYLTVSTKLKSPYEKIVEKCIVIHNNKYVYEKPENYINTTSKLNIICPVHGKFTQVANDHLSGKGCQDCANLRRNKLFFNEPTILYYIYFPNINLYKIGITLESNGVTKRYQGEKEEYEIIHTKLFSDGKDAYKLEQQILRKYSKHRLKHKVPELISGHTECFTKDVLHLHNSTKKDFPSIL